MLFKNKQNKISKNCFASLQPKPGVHVARGGGREVRWGQVAPGVFAQGGDIRCAAEAYPKPSGEGGSCATLLAAFLPSPFVLTTGGGRMSALSGSLHPQLQGACTALCTRVAILRLGGHPLCRVLTPSGARPPWAAQAYALPLHVALIGWQLQQYTHTQFSALKNTFVLFSLTE
ncbi:Hypothetical predicted protein [Podarcis lilfordi]|uniref:Uncharacterized protein n=1 Tax=Podarcis lilfordi TaxID=74358 RepID=A0AA35PEG2_9SAUR|nr:Hypothetical predicted protein [Podarcis lilfordi]